MRESLSIFIVMLTLAVCTSSALPPQVSNISYAQRTIADGNLSKIVDISYDLEGNRSMFVEFFFSHDGGLSFPVVCTAVLGDAGSGVYAGVDKNASWDASVDWDQNFTEHGLIMIKATYGNQPTGIPGLDSNDSVPNHLVPSVANLEMIWVEPGSFTMGSPTTEAFRGTEETEHNVTLTNGFYLGKFEVTQAQYQMVMTGNTDGINSIPSQFSGIPNRPVEYVSWNSVQVFLNRLNLSEQTAGELPNGWNYALPTEAEWEYACRAGTRTAYSWGNDINSSNANYSPTGIEETTEVGSYPPNPWGFYDMHGNVSELVMDLYGGAYLPDPVTDPLGISGSWRVMRGGSWDLPGSNIRSSIRSSTPAYLYYYTMGFRICLKETP